MAFDAVVRKIESFCWLLSFANGGYVGPLVITASKLNDQINDWLVFRPYQTTPIELTGQSWVAPETDLGAFLACLPTFEKMIAIEPWKTVFSLILIWYFQAIQPSSSQYRGKPWPIVAIALGAALERLSVTILAKEMGERTGGSSDRIKNLLQKIGVLDADEDRKYAEIFNKVRNDATHPTQKGQYSDDERYLSLQYAKLWIEETLLWRLGYDSGYLRRIPGSKRYSFEKPRYDLNTRLSTW